MKVEQSLLNPSALAELLVASLCMVLIHCAGADALFEDAVAGLPGVRFGSVAWGDYDQDGLLDVLIAGATPSGRITQVWRNTSAGFTNINASFPGIDHCKALWRDIDNDGKLDVFLMGTSDSGALVQIWRNTGTAFSNIDANLPNIAGSAVWGDYDNDGRLDLLLAGATDPFTSVVQVWRNCGGGCFSNINAGLPALRLASVQWIDFDKDGWLDILLTGNSNSGSQEVIQLWRNTSGQFTSVMVGLSSSLFHFGSALADFDGDGWLDIFLDAKNNSTAVGYEELWRNLEGVFGYIDTGLPHMLNAFSTWGDFDNDGRSDLLRTGDVGTNTAMRRTYLFRNTSGALTNANANLPGISSGSAAWGDFDSDGRLDIILTGHHGDGPSTPLTEVWRSLAPRTNTPPGPPATLRAGVVGSQVRLSWEFGSDAETPTTGLSYNLRVGTTPLGVDVVSPQSASSGWRLVPEMGNRQQTQFALLRDLVPGTYYWAVQSIDVAFAGSAFALEQTFIVPPFVVSVETRPENRLYLQFRGRPGARYVLLSSTDSQAWAPVTELVAGSDGNFEAWEMVNPELHAQFFQLKEQ